MPVEHSVTPEQASSSTAVGYDLSESAMLKGERAELRAAHDARRACGEADVWKGVALSGGGIRSATFSLGALQALAAHGILPRMDYMSTVSGGGYIGSALQWWWSEARFNEAELEFK